IAEPIIPNGDTHLGKRGRQAVLEETSFDLEGREPEPRVSRQELRYPCPARDIIVGPGQRHLDKLGMTIRKIGTQVADMPGVDGKPAVPRSLSSRNRRENRAIVVIGVSRDGVES